MNGTEPGEGYYFDLRTRQVTHGRHHLWMHRMGPYPTEEAARRALDRARSRVAAWQVEREIECLEKTCGCSIPADLMPRVVARV